MILILMILTTRSGTPQMRKMSIKMMPICRMPCRAAEA